jgi:hypothetical protein
VPLERFEDNESRFFSESKESAGDGTANDLYDRDERYHMSNDSERCAPDA